MKVNIRPACTSDCDAWTQLWQEYLTVHKQSVPDTVTALTWRRILDDNSTLFCLIAAGEGDEPVGFANCVVHPSTWTQARWCYLEDLYVDAGLRGKGIARKLIETIYSRADAEDWGGVYWVTDEDNYAARILYDKLAKKSEDIIYYREK